MPTRSNRRVIPTALARYCLSARRPSGPLRWRAIFALVRYPPLRSHTMFLRWSAFLFPLRCRYTSCAGALPLVRCRYARCAGALLSLRRRNSAHAIPAMLARWRVMPAGPFRYAGAIRYASTLFTAALSTLRWHTIYGALTRYIRSTGTSARARWRVVVFSCSLPQLIATGGHIAPTQHPACAVSSPSFL